MISIIPYYNPVNRKLGLSHVQMGKLKPRKGKSLAWGLKIISERAGFEPKSVCQHSPKFYFALEVMLPLCSYRLGSRLRRGEEIAHGPIVTPRLSWDLNFCLLLFCIGHSEVTHLELPLERSISLGVKGGVCVPLSRESLEGFSRMACAESWYLGS